MADVYDYVQSTGVILTDTDQIQEQVQSEYQEVFGNDLNVSPNTPQGLLITTETLARIAVADNNAQVANQINPNQAGGVFLDALGQLTGLARTPATPSSVVCTITGVAGTIIPTGAQISDSSGVNLFQLSAQIIIPSSGTITNVSFISVNAGPVPGLANTLQTIVSNILGWETVNNPNDAILGQATQSDVSFRTLRNAALGLQGQSLAQAIIAGLFTTTNVASVTFQENTASTTETINDVPMVRNSLYVCAATVNYPPTSADLTAIAQTLTNKKSGGCAYNNGLGIPQSVVYTNPYSLQPITVLFDTVARVIIGIQVTVSQYTSVQNITQSVQNAILAYAAGQIPNEPGFVVGVSVSPFQIAGAINILVPGLFVQEVQVGIISFDQIGTTSNTSTTISGMTYTSALSTQGITGTGIPASTTVASVVDSNNITISNAAEASGTVYLTFTNASVSYQTTEIDLAVWQKAVTNADLISVTLA